MTTRKQARVRRERAGVLLIGCLALLSCGDCATAPLAEFEPSAEDRRGGSERAQTDARALLLERIERADLALRAIDGYEAVIEKEERIDGRLFDVQRMECKVRHEPFSVYLRFVAPQALVGQEALWAGERYDGKMIARGSGAASLLGPAALDPEGSLAMRGNRHPITETGLLRLLERVRGFLSTGPGLEQLVVLEGALVDDRACTVFEAIPGPGADYALVRVYFDDGRELPVAFEAFEQGEEQLRLLERFSYLSLRLDAELGDDDFDRANPEYRLR